MPNTAYLHTTPLCREKLQYILYTSFVPHNVRTHALNTHIMYAGLSLLRGVITQPLWHVRFPRGGLEDAFGSSATTAGLLPKCRYVLPPESYLFSISRVERPKEAKNIRLSRKKNQDIETKLPDAKKHSMMPLVAFQVQKRRLECDAMHQCAHRQDELPSVAGGASLSPFGM
jgi:hypothetical protein